MRRHHVYNFHIGFWGSMFLSLLIMMQSALFLVFTGAVAQTQPTVTISAPVQNEQFNLAQVIAISAQTSSPVFTPVQFTITDTNNQIVDSKAGSSTDQVTWTTTWQTNTAGAYTIVATSGGVQSIPVSILVGSTVLVTVTIQLPNDGAIITDPLDFVAQTDVPVDRLRFILSSGTTPDITFDAVAEDAAKTIWRFPFVPQSPQNGTYTFIAVAELGGQTFSSSSRNVTVQVAEQSTLNITTPANNQTVSGVYTFSAVTSKSGAASVTFQITDANNNIVSNLNAQPRADQFSWQATFNTTTIPNGTYSLVAFATFPNEPQPVLSQNIAITINNQVVTTQPLTVLTALMQDGTVGVPYSQLLVASGGTAPYTWSVLTGALPAGLTLQGGTGTIAGTPTVSGDYSITVRVRDANTNTFDQPYSFTINPAPTVNNPTPTQPNPDNTTQTPTPTQPTITPVVTIKQPAANATIGGISYRVDIEGNVPLGTPQVLLIDRNGKDHLLGKNNRAYTTLQSNEERNWQFDLNTTQFENGDYFLQVSVTPKGQATRITSSQVRVTIENKAASTVLSGSIIAPRTNASVSGKVLLQAKVTGDVGSLSFQIVTAQDGTKLLPAIYYQNIDTWQAVWDTAGIKAGGVAIRAEAVSKDGQTVPLTAVNAKLEAETAPLLVAPVPAPVINPTVEQIIEPTVLQNIDQTAIAKQIPVECQIVAIKDERACNQYLAERVIRILSPQEQVKVRQDLGAVVTRHIEVSGGKAVERDFTQPAQTQIKTVQDPLAEIIPINKEIASQTSVLVLTSTEPPANLKPFVQQTVPAVLVFDQDGDGLSDEAELRYGTDPNNPDTDGDGYNDGVEVKNGFSPLGPGVLEQPVAPIDEAILNNRPLEQPRFAGVIDKESVKVEVVTTPQEDDTKPLLITGKGQPFSFITLYIYSSLPIVVTVQANESGNWQYEFSHPLVDGKHDVYATVTNDTGKIVKKSEPFGFFVRAAQAVSEEEFLASNVEIRDTSSTFLAYYVLAGVLIIVLGGVLFFYYLRQRVHFI